MALATFASLSGPENLVLPAMPWRAAFEPLETPPPPRRCGTSGGPRAPDASEEWETRGTLSRWPHPRLQRNALHAPTTARPGASQKSPGVPSRGVRFPLSSPA